ncbi:MAG: hypothetical protein SFV17_05530 [Candidatus Obscuribacter sp.]|nr:hypothetical protein [Candidatus Obscuribacter sp.]
MSNSKQGVSDTDNTVVSRTPHSSEVTVYSGGPAIVREQRQVEMKDGKVVVTLEGLPEHYVPGSLTITGAEGPGALKLGAFSYRPASLSVEAILEKAAGKEITLKSGDVETKGILRHVLGNQIVLEVDGKVQILVNDGTLSLDPACLSGLTTMPSIRLEATIGKAGGYGLGVMYATEGLSWSQRFEAFYDAAEEKLRRLACWVDLTNNTGAPIGSTRFQLIAGYNNGYGGGNYARPRGARMMAMAASASPMGGGLESAAFGADSAEVETVGEQKLYTLPLELALEAGETKTTSLMLAEAVPVVQEYLLSQGYFTPAAQLRDRKDKLPVHVRLTIKNDAASNLGVALPPGQVNIFEPDSKGSLQRTDSAQVSGHVAVGESFQLMLSTPSKDVKAQRRMVSSTDDPEEGKDAGAGNGDKFPIKPLGESADAAPAMSMGGPTVGMPAVHRVEIATDENPAEAEEAGAKGKKKEKPRFRTEVREVVVFNFKGKEVDVLVQDALPPKATFVKPISAGESAVKKIDKANGLVSYVVTVPAGGETVVAYTIKYRIN